MTNSSIAKDGISATEAPARGRSIDPVVARREGETRSGTDLASQHGLEYVAPLGDVKIRIVRPTASSVVALARWRFASARTVVASNPPDHDHPLWLEVADPQ